MEFKKILSLWTLLLLCYSFSYAAILSHELAKDSYNEAVTLHKLGRYQDAKGAYQKAIMLGLTQKEHKAAVLNNLGVIFAQEADLAKAEDAFRQALKINSEYKTARLNLGILHAMQANRNELINYSLKVSNAANSRPSSFIAPGGIDESLLKNCSSRLCQKTLLNLQGVGHAQAEEWGEAEEAFKAALIIDPDYKIAALNLALLYEKRKDQQVSLDYWLNMFDINLDTIKEKDFIIAGH